MLGPRTPALGSWSLSHWITREVPFTASHLDSDTHFQPSSSLTPPAPPTHPCKLVSLSTAPQPWISLGLWLSKSSRFFFLFLPTFYSEHYLVCFSFCTASFICDSFLCLEPTLCDSGGINTVNYGHWKMNIQAWSSRTAPSLLPLWLVKHKRVIQIFYLSYG